MQSSRSQASEKVGSLVRDIRQRAGVSRSKLARWADVDVRHVARIEQGMGNPTVFVIIQLATALDVEPAALLEGLTAEDLPDDIKPYSGDLSRHRAGESGRA